MEKKRVHKDVVIIGAGMAGFTAALYAGRMNLSVLVLENGIVGGQIANATGIENYPGFLKISSGELIDTVASQAEKFGALTSKGIDFAVHNIEINEADRVVPTTTADDEKYVLGFDKAKLDELLGL